MQVLRVPTETVRKEREAAYIATTEVFRLLTVTPKALFLRR